jgi:SAM-dependent methyltransferase
VNAFDASAIRQAIMEKYRRTAVSPEGLFRYPTGEKSALGLGYPARLISAVPATVRSHFVGVGYPFALGAIQPGETVLDLGCGAGFDALVAGIVVGPTGRVVGVDLSAEMLAVAEDGRTEMGLSNVQFQEASIEQLPLQEDAFDVALSNGVLNLIPDKPAALREIFRVLKAGGRLQACDMGLTGEEPPPDKSPWSD